MSIPGLGQIPTQPTASSSRIVSLARGQEWRFQSPHGGPVTVKLLSGTAEKDGTELAPGATYTFTGVRSKILTWQRCELEIEGQPEHERISPASDNVNVNTSANAAVNLHAHLNELRAAAGRRRSEGPRVLVAGPRGAVGKTTLVRTLTAYATRQGYQPLVINADPEDAILTLPGTISAAVFGTIMDVEAVGDGWGGTPTSGPSPVPVKLPLVHYFGSRTPSEEPGFYRQLASKLAGAASARLNGDDDVRPSGIIVDSVGVDEGEGNNAEGVDLLAHIIEEVSINIIVVVGSTSLEAQLSRRFATEKTSLGEDITVVQVDKSDGVAWRDEPFQQHARELIIKEYFFGNTRRSLSPQIQQVEFDRVHIYRVSPYGSGIEREECSLEMQHWTFAIMNASLRDSPETIRLATVMGFVYVSDVDEDRRKIKLLSPVSGRLGDRPLVWGRWPEPYINLLG